MRQRTSSASSAGPDWWVMAPGLKISTKINSNWRFSCLVTHFVWPNNGSTMLYQYYTEYTYKGYLCSEELGWRCLLWKDVFLSGPEGSTLWGRLIGPWHDVCTDRKSQERASSGGIRRRGDGRLSSISKEEMCCLCVTWEDSNWCILIPLN